MDRVDDLTSLVSQDQSERDDGGIHQDNYYGGFDSAAIATVTAIKEDFGRQLELVASRQNTMVQIIGILLAFASVLFVEAIHLCTGLDNIPYIGAVIAFLICCMVGILSLWQWRRWELYTGFNLDEVIMSFNDWRFFEIHIKLLNGVVRSYDLTSMNNYVLKNRITYMVVFLLVGTILLLIGLVTKWV